MNIFYLGNPQTSAQELCDKHVVKMITESAQMLCAVHWCKADTLEKVQECLSYHLFKPAHINHPSTIWTRETNEQYLWHYELYVEMCKEYTRRYGKIHGSSKFIGVLNNPPEILAQVGENLHSVCLKNTNAKIQYKRIATITLQKRNTLQSIN